jgi:hypothetical protein
LYKAAGVGRVRIIGRLWPSFHADNAVRIPSSATNTDGDVGIASHFTLLLEPAIGATDSAPGFYFTRMFYQRPGTNVTSFQSFRVSLAVSLYEAAMDLGTVVCGLTRMPIQGTQSSSDEEKVWDRELRLSYDLRWDAFKATAAQTITLVEEWLERKCGTKTPDTCPFDCYLIGHCTKHYGLATSSPFTPGVSYGLHAQDARVARGRD